MWFETILVVICALAAIIAILLFFGAWRWRAATKAMRARLEAGRITQGAKAYSPEELNGLPPPVQRYFRTVLKDGQPMIAAVHLKQAGMLNLGETGDSWRRFAAVQRVITQKPASTGTRQSRCCRACRYACTTPTSAVKECFMPLFSDL